MVGSSRNQTFKTFPHFASRTLQLPGIYCPRRQNSTHQAIRKTLARPERGRYQPMKGCFRGYMKNLQEDLEINRGAWPPQVARSPLRFPLCRLPSWLLAGSRQNREGSEGAMQLESALLAATAAQTNMGRGKCQKTPNCSPETYFSIS